MALEATQGPEIVWGQNPPASAGQAPPDYNPDRAPSGGDLGWGVIDPRYGYRIGGSFNPSALIGGSQPNPQTILFLSASEQVCVDQAPSTASATNIAALQAGTTAALALVSTSGAGITVMSSPLAIPQTGLVVPSGTLAIDLLPGLVFFGQNGNIALVDPTHNIARAVSAAAATGATATSVTIAGFDLYGQPQNEQITLTAGATVNGKKGWKFITSATLNAADGAHSYSIGTADIFEFPLRVIEFPTATVGWNNAIVAASTGFTAADTTSPATSTTGSVRGTYAVQSASDGTKILQMYVSPRVADLAAVTPTSVTSLFGVTPA